MALYSKHTKLCVHALLHCLLIGHAEGRQGVLQEQLSVILSTISQ